MLAFQQIEFLAHTVGNGEVHLVREKIEAIQNIPASKTKKKQVRSFIGVVGFCRIFKPHFADKSAVLTDLTSKGRPNKVQWTEVHENASNDLKSASILEILQNPDFTCDFILQSDACERGFGAVLLQLKGKCRHPIIFISKKLQPREQKYSTIEKECLAIVMSCQTLCEYLLGREFLIETDHFPLQWLNKMKDQNMRLLRWSLILQEYRFTVTHISGKTNVLADMLSRAY